MSNWPTPRNVTEVRAFVALASYYRQHIKSFAEIARPLHEITKKNQQFYWKGPQERAFNRLKQALTSAPLLAMPIDRGRYVLDTDAKNFSMGCVLQQWQNGELRVIGYASKAFSESELRYCTTRRELTAIIFGLKYYRHFLLGNPFVLRTDHAALSHLKRTPHPVAQSARYLDILAEYNFTVKYRPGESHKNADALSRRPCNRYSASPLCKQCGPLLEPIDEIGEDDKREGKGSNRLSAACVTAMEGRKVKDQSMTENEQIVGTTLCPEAPIFVPKAYQPRRADGLSD